MPSNNLKGNVFHGLILENSFQMIYLSTLALFTIHIRNSILGSKNLHMHCHLRAMTNLTIETQNTSDAFVTWNRPLFLSGGYYFWSSLIILLFFVFSWEIPIPILIRQLHHLVFIVEVHPEDQCVRSYLQVLKI